MGIFVPIAAAALIISGCSNVKSKKQEILYFFLTNGTQNTPYVNDLAEIAANNGWDMNKIRLVMKTVESEADKQGYNIAINFIVAKDLPQIMLANLKGETDSPDNAFIVEINLGYNIKNSNFSAKDIEAAAAHENRHIKHFYWAAHGMNDKIYVFDSSTGLYKLDMKTFVNGYLQLLMRTTEKDLGPNITNNIGDISILCYSIGKYAYPDLSMPLATGQTILFLSTMLQEVAVLTKATDMEFNSKSLSYFINESIEKETILALSQEQIDDPGQAGMFFNTIIKIAMFSMLSDKKGIIIHNPKFKLLQKKIKEMKYKDINKIYGQLYDLFYAQYCFANKYMPQ